MKLKMKYLILLLPLLCAKAAFGQGIKFEEKLSWLQVKEKAEAEHKNIFVDCYATWCGPCKKMDQEVYPEKKVGDSINNLYVSVKVQMDKTEKDNNYVKSWYNDAKAISDQYNISAFPTLLFITPKGELINKSVGYKSLDGVINLAMFVKSPVRKDYAKRMRDYNEGKRDYKRMPDLIMMTRDVAHNGSLAREMAKDYKKNYIPSLTDDQLCTKQNLQFIRDYYDLMEYGDNTYKLMAKYPGKVDSLWGSKLADLLVEQIILTDLDKILYSDAGKGDRNIPPMIPREKEPNWDRIAISLSKKFNALQLNETFPIAREIFYSRTENWIQYVNWTTRRYMGRQLTTREAEALNDNSLNLFYKCLDVNILEFAVSWCDKTIETVKNTAIEATCIDTKASLLYKMGKTAEAIACEQIAVETASRYAAAHNGELQGWVNDFSAIVEKMKKGEHIYEEDGAVWPKSK